MYIKTKNLSKKYFKAKSKSLDNVDLVIPKGIFGLIGENGAGKTTLLKTLTTILPINDGEVSILDYKLPEDENKVRGILGYLPQEFDLFHNLTAYEMLDYIALLKEVLDKKERDKQILDLLDKLNLSNKKDTKIKALSGGMKQRLGIAQCLLGNPKVIILDEPTVGLDPKERLRFRNVLHEVATDKIVIISSHIVSDISMMCENVAILNKGKVSYCGSIEELTEKVRGKVFLDYIESHDLLNSSLYEKIISISRRKNKLEVRFISENPKDKSIYKEVEPNLEDAYFYMSFIKGNNNE